jgi:ADP-ribosylglycohydrolase
MAALTLSEEIYRDKVLGGWRGKSAGITLGAPLRGQLTPGRNNYYSPVPGQPSASIAMDYPLVWLAALEQSGPGTTPEDLAVAWLEHLDYPQDEFGYAALNLRRGLPPPASGAHSNWFRHASGGIMRADFWALIAPGAPQVAAAYAYHDSKLDHSEDGIWAAMFLAALTSAAFFLSDPLTLVTIGLAMIPRTCRTARAIKTALAAAQRAAAWLEARESVQHEVGHQNYTDVPQNMGFFTIGLLYGGRDFGASLCAAVNCGYDAEVVGGALGAVFGVLLGQSGLPEDWTRPLGDIVIPGYGMRDFEPPPTLTEVAERTIALGRQMVADRCPDVEIRALSEASVDAPSAPSPASPEIATQERSGDAATPAPGPAAPMTSAPNLTPEPAPVAPAAFVEFPERTPSEMPSPAALDAPAAPAADFSIPAANVADTTSPPSNASTTDAAASPLDAFTAQAPAHEAEAPSGFLPGTFVPQAVNRAETGAIPHGTSPDTPDGTVISTPLASDPMSAIAWADSTHVKPLLVTPPYAQVGQAGPFEVILDSGDSPTLAFNMLRPLSFLIVNRGEQAFSGRVSVLAPPGWSVAGSPNFGQRQYIAAHTGTLRADFNLRVLEGQGRIDIANTVTLRFAPEDGSAPLEAEFILMGASCWWTVGSFANFDGEGFDRSYAPEDRPGLNETYIGRNLQNARWEKYSYPECTLDLEPLFRGSSGVCYGLTILRSPTTREARLVAHTNTGVKVWLNGALILRRMNRETFRPVLGSGPWAVDISLRAGDNPVMVKWVRGSEPYEFSLTVSDRAGRGLPEVGNTSW